MISRKRVNAYRVMWLFVFFDLPVMTRKERKAAALFRKNIRKDGFEMMQYSVYSRFCASDEKAKVHIRRVKGHMPETGQVTILKVTDKQYGDIINYWSRKRQANPGTPTQIEMF